MMAAYRMATMFPMVTAHVVATDMMTPDMAFRMLDSQHMCRIHLIVRPVGDRFGFDDRIAVPAARIVIRFRANVRIGKRDQRSRRNDHPSKLFHEKAFYG